MKKNFLLFVLVVTTFLPLVPRAFGGSEGAGSALWREAINGNKEAVKAILEKGGNIDEPSKTGMTPLMWAIQDDQPELVEFLIKKGANVNARQTSAGCNAVIIAADWLQADTVDLLIKNGAEINYQSRSGWTALLKATRVAPKDAEEGDRQLRTIKTLLGKGAKVDVATNKGVTPLMYAAKNGNLPIIDLLLEKHADLNIQDKEGQTALMWAAMAGQAGGIKHLLSKGAVIETKTVLGSTALMLAAEHGQTEVVKTLLENKADIVPQDEDGMTALMLAAKNGHLEAVELLLAHNAKVNEVNKKGATARLLSVENHHEEVENLLREAGGRCF